MRFIGILSEIAYDIDMDAYGDVYVAGITGGNFAGTSSGQNDIFIAKFASGGAMEKTVRYFRN